MGMIFQSAALFDSMTVLENVMFPLDMFSSMTLRDRIHRARTCLDRVNLAGTDHKFPGELSGGMQKRVAIARAISLNPKYLFCDEPTSATDMTGRKIYYRTMRNSAIRLIDLNRINFTKTKYKATPLDTVKEQPFFPVNVN